MATVTQKPLVFCITRDITLDIDYKLCRCTDVSAAQVTGNRDVRIELRSATKKDELVERDPIQLAIFSHRRACTPYILRFRRTPRYKAVWLWGPIMGGNDCDCFLPLRAGSWASQSRWGARCSGPPSA